MRYQNSAFICGGISYSQKVSCYLSQNEPENRKTFGELPGSIDSLLQQLAYYKRHNPNTEEEKVRMSYKGISLYQLKYQNVNTEPFKVVHL